MQREWSRRRFLGRTGVIAAGLATAASGAFAQAPAAPTQMPGRRSDPLPDALVNEWVWRGHFDLEGVKRMLGEHPTLLNAEYDWGNGDYQIQVDSDKDLEYIMSLVKQGLK